MEPLLESVSKQTDIISIPTSPSINKITTGVNAIDTYNKCRKEAGPITCVTATGAKIGTNYAVKSVGGAMVATGLATSKIGVGIPMVVAGVCVGEHANQVSKTVYKSVVKTGQDYTQCRKTNNAITCGLAIGSEKIFETITNKPHVGKFVRDRIVNVADLAHKTWIEPHGPKDRIINFANSTQKTFDELKGVRVNTEPIGVKLPGVELTYSFETQNFCSKYGKTYSCSCPIDIQYLKEILHFFDNDVYNFKMSFTSDDDNGTDIDFGEIIDNKIAIDTLFEPNELRSTKMGKFMYEADLVLKQLLGMSKKINDNTADLYDETRKVHSYCAFFDLFPYDVDFVSSTSIINLTKRNIKCVFHSYEINLDNINSSNQKNINFLVKQRNQFMKEYESKLNSTFDTLKIRFAGEKRPLHELEEICKALTIALIIKTNNCKYELNQIQSYVKIPKRTLVNLKHSVKLPRHDDILAGGITMSNGNLFFQKFKSEISTFLKTGKMPLKLEQSFVKNIMMKELFDYNILCGEYIYCQNNFVHKDNFDFSIYQVDFDKIMLELQDVYIDVFEKYQTDENKLKKYLKKFALKHTTNKFCILLLDNIDHPIFNELNIIIIDKFQFDDSIGLDEQNQDQDQDQLNYKIFCKDKYILVEDFNWKDYNKDFKLIYSEFEKFFFDLMDKYESDDEKFRKYLKKFALKYPTNKFCNLLLDNVDKSSFYDLNVIIAKKITDMVR